MTRNTRLERTLHSHDTFLSVSDEITTAIIRWTDQLTEAGEVIVLRQTVITYQEIAEGAMEFVEQRGAPEAAAPGAP